MRRPKGPRGAVTGLACALVLTGCSTFQGTGDKGYLTTEGTVREIAPEDRGEPIQLSGEGLDGEALDVADWAGKPVVVVVWAPWCPPCREEAPDVVAAAKELGDRAQFVGINIRNQDPSASQAFVRKAGLPYPSFFDKTGEAILAFSGTLTAYSIPSFVVLDEQGRIGGSIIGTLPSTATLVGLVEDVAAGKAIGDGTGDG
jgi:thiol-disulfide isomerase/thioredoxin